MDLCHPDGALPCPHKKEEFPMKRRFSLVFALLLILSMALTPALAAKAKTTLTLSHKGTVTLDVGATLKITATVSPEAPVQWKSSKTKVATVDTEGNVLALAEGTTTISAKAGGKTAKVKIRVVDPTKPTKLALQEGKKKTRSDSVFQPARFGHREKAWINGHFRG